MIFKVAIVEDDDSCAEQIQGYIDKYSQEISEKFEITRFKDGIEIASDYNPQFDIIFLDIQMKQMNGMETAKYIRKMDKDVILVFITNMAQYALKGYSVDALDFLLKPVPYFAFAQQLKRSVEKIKKRKNSFLLLPTENGIVKLELSYILFIESFKHKMTVHTADDTYIIRSTMIELENKLASHNFFRCNKSYLINLEYVNSVKGNSVILDKHELAIGRTKKKAFMEALTEYVGGVTK